MDVKIRVAASPGTTDCSVEFCGLPSVCEADELKQYLEINCPTVKGLFESILKAHKEANAE